MHDTDVTLLKAATRFARAAQAFVRREGADGELTPELDEMLALLATQAEWRMFVDGTRNLGHQASTVKMLRRLIELTGFAGRVVIVYADHGRPLLGCTAAKLALMFTGVDPSRLDEAVAGHGSCTDIRFLPFERRSELRDAVAFGFTGGADDMALNCALQLKVRFFARIQPYLWDDEAPAKTDPYYEGSRIEQPDGSHLYLVDAFPEFRRLPMKHAPCSLAGDELGVWDWYGREQTFDAGLACRTRNMRRLYALRHAEAAELRLWPLYGLQHFKDSAAEMFLVCVLCALRLQRTRQGSIVLVSFCPHDELLGWGCLVDALANDLAHGDAALSSLRTALRHRHGIESDGAAFWETYLDSWACDTGEWLREVFAAGAGVLAHHGHDADSGRWVDLPDRSLEALGRTGVPQVHLVALGPVPMDVFDACLAHADLPAVIEGQVACNLMIGLGRPFLQVLRGDHVIKNSYPGPEEGVEPASVAEEAHRAALLIRDLRPPSGPTFEAAPGRYGAGLDCIVNFVLRAQDEAGDVASYFEALRCHSARDANDKLLVALLALRQVVLAGTDDNP